MIVLVPPKASCSFRPSSERTSIHLYKLGPVHRGHTPLGSTMDGGAGEEDKLDEDGNSRQHPRDLAKTTIVDQARSASLFSSRGQPRSLRKQRRLRWRPHPSDRKPLRPPGGRPEWPPASPSPSRETAKTLPGAGAQWDKSPGFLISNHLSQRRVRKGHTPIWFPGVSPYIA